MSGKMSLVVLQSWCDAPPKIKGIAPQDDERSVKLEPDHHGHFLAEEIPDPEHDPRFTPRGRTFSTGSKGHTVTIPNGTSVDYGYHHHQNGSGGILTPEEPLFIRRKNGRLEKNMGLNRHSYCGFGESGSHANSPSPTGTRSPVGRSMSNLNYSTGNGRPDSLSIIRPDSGGTNSPDQQDGSSMEYTPPSSPISGRYRNLGPELASTIPKRAIKSNWISGIKSRWMNRTTHPDSFGRSTLKSYSSSPSLVATSCFSTEGPSTTETPLFFNPLYRLSQQQHFQSLAPLTLPSDPGQVKGSSHFRSVGDPGKGRGGGGGSTGGSSGSTSGIALDDDSHSDRSRSSLSNPALSSSYSPSPPPTAHHSPNPTNVGSLSPVASLRQRIVYNSSRPNGLTKCNSLTDFSEEDLFCESVSSGRISPTGSQYYHHGLGYGGCGRESRLQSSPHSQGVDVLDECVLVEVIRKSETPNSGSGKGCNKNGNARVGGLSGIKTGGGEVKSEKRHSIGELEQEPPLLNNKFVGVKVEGSPGKVARIKENIKKFGRFGRANSEKVLRFQTGEPEKIDKKAKLLEEIRAKGGAKGDISSKPNIDSGEKLPSISHSFEEGPPPIPTARKRSKNSDTELANLESIKAVQVQGSGSENLSNLQKPPQTPPQPQNLAPTLTETSQEIEPKDPKLTPQFDISVGHLPESQFKITSDKSHPLNQFPDSEIRNEDNVFSVIQNFVCKIEDNNEEPAQSLIDDQDRSISTHLQSLHTLDIETFIVHSGITPSQTNIDAKTTSGDKDGNLHVHVEDHLNLDNNFQSSEQELFLLVPDRVETETKAGKVEIEESDKMFKSRSNKGTKPKSKAPMPPGFFPPEMLENNNGNVKSVTNNLTHFSNNGVASVQVPVQAINRHVMGFGGRENIYANSVEEDDRGSGSPGSASSDSRSTDFEWPRSSTRASFRGFCEELLQDEKLTLQVPEVVEASISFDEDSSSLDPDEERENSVDYISIADVKVSKSNSSSRKEKSSTHAQRSRDRDPGPSCVISLDIGSRGSGYSYWVKDEDDCVRIGHVDSGSPCPKSHKIPSWVSVDDLYMDGDEEENGNAASSPAFGYHALNRFMSEQTQSHLFWKWRENFNEGSTFPYTLESKANDEELQFTMKSAIKHYGKISLDQIASKRIGNTLGKTIFAITIPANFDNRARQIVRDAAFGTGLVSKKDALALVEDPCAAGIYAYHAIKHKIAKMNNIGTSFLSVDIGGVYVHSSGYDYKEGKLYQILIPSSQPISENPESLFELELSGIFTPSFILNYQTKYKAGWLKLMTEFDQCKNLYDPIQRGSYHVFIPSSFVDHFRRFTSMEVEDALESTELSWSRVGALGIPFWKMQRFLQPMMDFIKNHIVNIAKNRHYEFLVLTGGRSGSRQLVDYLKNAVRVFSIDVIVPKEYNAAVLQGCTISLTKNLAPRLIIKSPFSIGVGVMTPFIEKQHPEEKRVKRDGKSWCADVWDALILKGQDLEMNNIVLRRSYVGAQPGQSLLHLPLFQSSEEPKFVTEESVRKCCEFKFNSDQRAWQEVELIIKCRPSELLIMAVDDGVTKNVVVLDFAL